MGMAESISVVLQYNGGTSTEMDYWLQRKLWGVPCIFRPQNGNSLGDKLKNAIKESFGRGNQSVVVIGNQKIICLVYARKQFHIEGKF